MRITTTRIIATLAIAGSLAAVSCKKKEPEPAPVQDTEQSTATDNNIAELIAADLESIGSQASETATLVTYRSASEAELQMAPCATVIVNPTLETVSVDFGTGCLCADGRTRSGKIIYDYSSSAGNAHYYRNPGFRMTVAAQNYVVDGHSVTINSKVVENTTPLSLPTGTNPGTNLTWSVAADLTILKPNNGGTIIWKCSRTKELVNTSDPDCYKGQSDYIRWGKAIIRLNGTASGTNAKSESFTAVASNVERDFECAPDAMRPHRHPFIKGTLVYTPGNRPARHIDYGNGSCDFTATITINNVKYVFNLP